MFIDYAHTPDALEAVLQTLSGICQGKLITVFGCGGERDRGKRREMGELAVFYSASVIVTSDNPRSEDPLAIIADIMSGFGGECTAAEAVPDRKNAIRQAVFYAAPGDIVLIAGKGHEKTQHTAVGLISFSDFEVAQQALREKSIFILKKRVQNRCAEIVQSGMIKENWRRLVYDDDRRMDHHHRTSGTTLRNATFFGNGS